MDFKRRSTTNDGDDGTTTTTEKKSVYLPPRSALLMSGPARYEWEHQIVDRRTDTVNGVVTLRRTRVSLTLRTALDVDGATHLRRWESDDWPLRWRRPNDDDNNDNDDLRLLTPECEKRHVHDVYDAVAE